MMGHPEVGALSLAIIERINQSGISCSILTKGVLPDELANRPRFPADNVYGISLVSLDESFRRRWAEVFTRRPNRAHPVSARLLFFGCTAKQ